MCFLRALTFRIQSKSSRDYLLFRKPFGRIEISKGHVFRFTRFVLLCFFTLFVSSLLNIRSIHLFRGGGVGGQKKAERKAANPNFSGNTEILYDLSFTAISVREPLIHIILIS